MNPKEGLQCVYTYLDELPNWWGDMELYFDLSYIVCWMLIELIQNSPQEDAKTTTKNFLDRTVEYSQKNNETAWLFDIYGDILYAIYYQYMVKDVIL